MEKYLYITIFTPLLSAFICALFATQKRLLFIGILASFFLAISSISSFYLLYYIYITQEVLNVILFNWIEAGNLSIPFGFLVDNVSVVMISMICLISTIIHIYSIYYMENDKSFNRYFAYLSLFVFSMLILVLADNFAVLFVGWEFVGLCSWLLIGFWYEKESSSKAANEAFVMNRIGDLGLLIAMFLIYWNLGTLQYDGVFGQISSLDNSTLIWIGVLLFVGAMGKSAIFPLHTWLVNAMAGPTPVSALIHAATMVTAGVYLIIRANELYILIPVVSYAIAIIGTFLALFAASMAIVSNDMKKIIAYSTLSQLGYMYVAVGLGAYWIALFHLISHAFFKSLLFLGAGNIMHSLGNELDIRKMGKLYSKMKTTAILMIIASLALSGIFPFAGFFSKDKILEVAFDTKTYILWISLLVGTGLSSFYSFRLIMKIFFVDNKEFINPIFVKTFAIISMVPLAIFSFVLGWFEHSFIQFTTKILPTWDVKNLGYASSWILILLTTFVALGGILFAIYKYKNGKEFINKDKNILYKILINQYYIPQVYNKYIIKPYYSLSLFIWKVVEIKIIDGLIDGVANRINIFGKVARPMQTGNLSSTLRLMIFGLILGLVFSFTLAIF